jgi:hypothetical protein
MILFRSLPRKPVLWTFPAIVCCWILVAGCSDTGSSEGSIEICGKTLLKSPFVPRLYDASTHSVMITTTDAAPVAYVKIAAGCDTGATISISPSEGNIVAQVNAQDGRPVAVGINPKAPKLTAIIDHDARTVTVTVLSDNSQPAPKSS